MAKARIGITDSNIIFEPTARAQPEVQHTVLLMALRQEQMCPRPTWHLRLALSPVTVKGTTERSNLALLDISETIGNVLV